MFVCPISGMACDDSECGADGCRRTALAPYVICTDCGNLLQAGTECWVCTRHWFRVAPFNFTVADDFRQ